MTLSKAYTLEEKEENDSVSRVTSYQAISTEIDPTNAKSSNADPNNILWLASLELEATATDDLNKSMPNSFSSPTSAATADLDFDTGDLPSLSKSNDGIARKNETGEGQQIQFLNISGNSCNPGGLSKSSSFGGNSGRLGISRSVSFAESVVTNVRETPRYKREDVSKMFYSREDIQRSVK